MRRSFKWLLRSIGIVFILVLMTAMAVVYTFTTESGTHWALNRLSGMAAGKLSIPEFRGNLWNGLELDSLTYQDENMELQAKDLEVGISWTAATRGRLVFDRLHAGHVLIRSKKLPDTVPKRFDLSFETVTLELGVEDGWVAHLETEGYGDTRDYREIRIKQLYLADGKARLDSGSLTLAELGINATLDDVNFNISGDFPLSGHLKWVLDDGDWSGQGPVSGSLARLVFDQELSSSYPLRMQGNVAILGQYQPEFDMNAAAVQWQVGDLTLSSGTAHLVGNTDGYRANYELNVLWPEFPPVRIIGTGEGNFQSLGGINALLDSDSGTAEVSGDLTWLPEFTADLDVGISGFDPAIVFKEFAGQLDGHAHLVVKDTDHYSFNDAQINGAVNQANFEASGSLLVSPENILCNQCVLVNGPNRAEIHGKTGPDKIAFDLKVNAPAIGAFWPGLGGKVQASGRVGGNFALPMFSGELQAEDLAFEGWTAKTLNITSTSSGLAEINLALTGQQLAFEDMALGKIEIAARGKTDQMKVDANWYFQDMVFTAGANLQTKSGSITGRVQHANLLESTTGDWTLREPLDFSYQQGKLTLSPHQWRGTAGSLDVSRFGSVNGETAVVAQMSDIPLQLANTFLPTAYRLEGTAQADIDLGYKKGYWNGTVNWSQTDTMLSLIEITGRQSEVKIPRVSLQALLENGGADITAQIAIDPGVSGELHVALERLARDSSMTAELMLEGQQWGWISALVPEIDNFAGSVSANFRAEGPLQTPQLTGALKLREGKLSIPALNVPLNDINLDLVGAPNGAAVISASATAGGRPLELKGRIENLLLEDRTIELELTGRAAELFNWPEYHVWASPEIKISGDASGWILNGQVSIPMAEVDVKELPIGAVEVSPDVRILGEQEQPGLTATYSGSVRVILGENVHVVAFGLDTRLTGSLQVGMYRDRPMSAEGRVKLEDGTFSAYGRELRIMDGTLNFTGPLDNPLVDVRAIREIDGINGKVIAGIHLTGRADNLTSTIYSEPAMGEADALSYVVLGRPLSQATLAEGNELSGAAIALGLGQASRITEQIGRTLGLDQLALASDGAEGTALVAGKQINNRLYARYAYGVFSRVGTLLLRYRLSRRLTLEAAAGEAQTIELLYTVEKP